MTTEPGLPATKNALSDAQPRTSVFTPLRIAWGFAFLAVLLQMLVNGRYGYFRDELYYLAASDHLAWGYVDLLL